MTRGAAACSDAELTDAKSNASRTPFYHGTPIQKLVQQVSSCRVSAVFVLLELMVAIFMEETTRKNSTNSSLPPSQTGKDESATRPGTQGRGSAGQAQRAGNTRTVEANQILKVRTCACCGEGLSDVAAADHERRTRIDIVFEKTVEHFDAEIKTCPSCEGTTKAPALRRDQGARLLGLVSLVRGLG